MGVGGMLSAYRLGPTVIYVFESEFRHLLELWPWVPTSSLGKRA